MIRILSLAIVVLLCACGGNSGQMIAADKMTDDCVLVLYFHAKKRCATCNAIERLTKEVVDSIANDKVVMRVIDISENEAIADKYEVTWSSLILDRGGRVENLTEMGFGCAKTQPEVFKAELTDAITRISE